MSAAPAVDERLPSRWVHAFAGACFLCVGLAFNYLDRNYGDFNRGLALQWMLATVAGFGTGAWQLGRGGPAARLVCTVLGGLGLLLAIYPTYQMYSLLRWLVLCLMFTAVARAALMRTRKDLYLSLAICFVCTSVIAIHVRADWTLWVYLGPAWVFAGLALTFEYVAARNVPRWLQVLSSVGFVGTVGVLALALFLALPRPPLLGFGFLPPGSNDPALAPSPVRKGGETGQGSGSGGVGSRGDSSAESHGSWPQMIQRMRPATQDPHMPAWQRDLLGALLDAMAALTPRDAADGDSDGLAGAAVKRQKVVLQIKLWWIALLLFVALLAWWAWRRRYVIALNTLSPVAWVLIPISPLRSMRVSARMIEYCLVYTDRPRPTALTLRERLALAHNLPNLSSQCFDVAVASYYTARFGRTEASASSAARMRLEVLDAVDAAIEQATR